MKKILLFLLFPTLAHAGTMSIYGTAFTIQITTPVAASASADTIVFDTSTVSTTVSYANPCSWTINIGNGSSASDKVAVLACASLGTSHVTSADIGGTSFTLQQRTNNPAGNGSTSEIWTAPNPTAGVQTVTVNVNTGNCGGVGEVTCTVADFTGVKQATPVDVSTGAVGATVQTVSAVRSTTVDKDYIISVGGNDYSGVTLSDGSSQTVLANVHNTVNGYNSAQAYKGAITPAGSTTITWNAVGGINSQMTACWAALQPGP